jgi:hypothetical protein
MKHLYNDKYHDIRIEYLFHELWKNKYNQSYVTYPHGTYSLLIHQFPISFHHHKTSFP